MHTGARKIALCGSLLGTEGLDGVHVAVDRHKDTVETAGLFFQGSRA